MREIVNLTREIGNWMDAIINFTRVIANFIGRIDGLTRPIDSEAPQHNARALGQVVQELVLRIPRGNDRPRPAPGRDGRDQHGGRIFGRRRGQLRQRRKDPDRQLIHLKRFRRGRRHDCATFRPTGVRHATAKAGGPGVSRLGGSNHLVGRDLARASL